MQSLAEVYTCPSKGIGSPARCTIPPQAARNERTNRERGRERDHKQKRHNEKERERERHAKIGEEKERARNGKGQIEDIFLPLHCRTPIRARVHARSRQARMHARAPPSLPPLHRRHRHRHRRRHHTLPLGGPPRQESRELARTADG